MAVFNCSTFATIVLASFAMDKVSALTMLSLLAAPWPGTNVNSAGKSEVGVVGLPVSQPDKSGSNNGGLGAFAIVSSVQPPADAQPGSRFKIHDMVLVKQGSQQGKVGRIVDQTGTHWKIQNWVVNDQGTLIASDSFFTKAFTKESDLHKIDQADKEKMVAKVQEIQAIFASMKQYVGQVTLPLEQRHAAIAKALTSILKKSGGFKFIVEGTPPKRGTNPITGNLYPVTYKIEIDRSAADFDAHQEKSDMIIRILQTVNQVLDVHDEQIRFSKWFYLADKIHKRLSKKKDVNEEKMQKFTDTFKKRGVMPSESTLWGSRVHDQDTYEEQAQAQEGNLSQNVTNRAEKLTKWLNAFIDVAESHHDDTVWSIFTQECENALNKIIVQ